MSAAATPASEVAVAPKTLSRPAYLTLSGLYATTKSVYSTYCPDKACALLEALASKLIVMGSPYIAKALPAPASPGTSKTPSVPSDLSELDALLLQCFTYGDAAIDGCVAKGSTAVSGYKAAASEKAKAVKSYVLGRYETTAVAAKGQVEAMKTKAICTMTEEGPVKDLVDKAAPYYEIAKDNAEPAKAVLTELAASAKADLEAKGVVSVAKESAETLKATGLAAMETVKAKGAVEGVRELSSSALATVVAKLEEAKATVEASPEAEGYSSAEDTAPAEEEEK